MCLITLLYVSVVTFIVFVFHSVNFCFFVFNLQRDMNGIKNLNWSKFIADELHKVVLKRKPTRGCLLFYNVSDGAFLLPSFLSFVIFLLFVSDFVRVYHDACSGDGGGGLLLLLFPWF